MVAINALQPGDVVFDVSREKMGNTTMTRVAVREVRIVSIDLARKSVEASWNGNGAKTYRERQIARWKRHKPASRS